jgi:hypothetical protein
MKWKIRNAIFVLSGFVVAASISSAQQVPQKDSQAATPATKLEAFSAKTGVVVIRGYTTVGVLKGMGAVTVDAREFRDAANLKLRVTGLSIEVKESGSLERESTSFIDYDEIDSLLQGIDYISKANAGITPMKNFEVEYKTKGDFAVITFNSQSGIGVAVSSGRFTKTKAYFKLADLPQLRTLIQNGKADIDAQGTKQ